MRNLIIQTKNAKHKWFELGVALKIPIDILEKLDIKYDDSPIKALIRVYRYWLADKNGLQPIWHKLITALHDINEYSIAAHVANNVMVSVQLLYISVRSYSSSAICTAKHVYFLSCQILIAIYL